MPRPTTLPQLMEEMKRRRKKRHSNPRLRLVYAFLFVTIIAVCGCFLVVSTPMLAYFIPIEKSGDSSSAPTYSLNRIMKSGGITDTENDFSIVGAELRRDGSRSWIVGTVTNTGGTSYKAVTVMYDLYDKDGSMIGSTYLMVGSIGPNESREFSTIPFTGLAATARLSYILGN